jgi:hypothetical protein
VTLPRVVMCSLWRDDAGRRLAERVAHLLSKAESYPSLAWVWVVGDSTDDTAETLRQLSTGNDVEELDIGSTGVEGDGMDSRLRRLSLTANHYLRHGDGAEYLLMHESDIESPANLVNLLVAHAEQGRCPIAGWPTLAVRPGVKWFYDCWAYRKDGVRFTNRAPYHAGYRPDKPFTVDSAGTVLMFHAEDCSEIIMSRLAVLELCWHLRRLGREIWVDPTLEVVQPTALWTYQQIEREVA